MFEFIFPWAFVLLPLPWVLYRALPSAHVTASSAIRVPFYQAFCATVLASSTVQALTLSRRLRCLCAWIWIWLVCACANPQWVGDVLPVAREGRNIMLALDVSGSMAMEDMVVQGQTWSRLLVVKQAAAQFVAARAADRIGLILFGSRAYLQTPLTFDHAHVMKRIEDATVGLAGKTTSLGDAIGLAIKRLQEVPKAGRICILLTDGASNSGVLSPQQAASLARAEGIKMYVIGLGSDARMAPAQALFFGLNPAAELDETTLKDIASTTGGRYFRATDLKSLQRIYQQIDAMEMVTQETTPLQPQRAYYPWCLMLAFIGWCGVSLRCNG